MLILNIARRYVEGPRRGVPYSVSKLKAYSALMYWRVRVKVQEEKNVNLQVIEKRLLDAEIEDSTFSKEQAKEMK